ncbi:ribosome-associated protein [Rosistilla carotiformis]|uniref:Ribosome-associated protein n=1 Tax=Rosistilla carotiformis TaxID=2528017 RepID=A0A518JVM0_9BACT|nr:RNA-binding S4 domain-containing protein [Rosistilla carotiformis]QDV69590.1 ribosome-associated protein [Rosistilla carotiformis]
MNQDVSNEPSTDEEDSIRLDNFIKLTGVVGTGGQAKMLIQNGEVTVNGEVETRRRKKLTIGDEIEVLGEVFRVEQD